MPLKLVSSAQAFGAQLRAPIRDRHTDGESDGMSDAHSERPVASSVSSSCGSMRSDGFNFDHVLAAPTSDSETSPKASKGERIIYSMEDLKAIGNLAKVVDPPAAVPAAFLVAPHMSPHHRNKPVMCYVCDGAHLARECPHIEDGKCFNCGGDHLARDCSAVAIGCGRGTGKCFVCGGGHFARECPLRNTPADPKAVANGLYDDCLDGAMWEMSRQRPTTSGLSGMKITKKQGPRSGGAKRPATTGPAQPLRAVSAAIPIPSRAGFSPSSGTLADRMAQSSL